LCDEQSGDKLAAGNSNVLDVDFASLPRQLQLRLKVSKFLILVVDGLCKSAEPSVLIG